MSETYHCQNCEWEGPQSALAPFSDMEERLEAGDTVPAGECPMEGCGATCWSDSELAKHRLEGSAPDLMKALDEFCEDIRVAYLGGQPDSELNHTALYKEWPDLCATFHNARAAIAKAKGGGA